MEELTIEPGRAERNYWRDLWRYRELFYFLAWRDVLVRYKQTIIGITWAVVRPFVMMVVFTVVFGRLAKLPAPGDVPYALMVFAALLPWQFFSESLNASSNSLVGNANLISKIYFPRLIVPASSVITAFVDLLISLGIMAGLMVWYQFAPDWRVLLCPVFMMLAFGPAIGIGLWLSALNVRFRDVKHVVPFIAQFGLYISPVGFSSSVVPENWRLLYSLNPMVGVIDGFRWCLLHGQVSFQLSAFLLSVLVTAILLLSGLWYFRKVERTFADVI